MARGDASIKQILGEMNGLGMLTPDLVISIEKWSDGLRAGLFGANAQTKDEAILRTRTMLGNLEGADEFALKWMGDKSDVDLGSELALRAKLSNEISFCIRKGGLDVGEGKVVENVAKFVEEKIYEIDPELKKDVDLAKSVGRAGVEGRVVEIKPGIAGELMG